MQTGRHIVIIDRPKFLASCIGPWTSGGSGTRTSIHRSQRGEAHSGTYSWTTSRSAARRLEMSTGDTEQEMPGGFVPRESLGL